MNKYNQQKIYFLKKNFSMIKDQSLKPIERSTMIEIDSLHHRSKSSFIRMILIDQLYLRILQRDLKLLESLKLNHKEPSLSKSLNQLLSREDLSNHLFNKSNNLFSSLSINSQYKWFKLLLNNNLHLLNNQ